MKKKKKGMKCPALAAARALFLPDREIPRFLLVVRIADGGPTAKPPAVVVRPLHCWSRERGTCARVRLRRGDKGLARRHRGVGPDRATGGTHPQGAGAATGAEAATEIGVAGAPTAGGTTAEGARGVATTAITSAPQGRK